MKPSRASREDMLALLGAIARRRSDERTTVISMRELTAIHDVPHPLESTESLEDLVCTPGTTGERREGSDVEIVVFLGAALRFRGNGTIECCIAVRSGHVAPVIFM